MRNNEHLQRLRRVEKSPKLGAAVKVTNKDYRKVKIKPNSVVYCDIPYVTNPRHYGIEFDFNEFYAWARDADFPVYFSGYDLLGYYRFDLVWEKFVPVKINTKLNGNKALYRTEKLFWNGRGV